MVTFERQRTDVESIFAPYGPTLFEEYYESWGERLEERLIELFVKNTDRAKLTRIRYYRTVASIARRDYIDVCADYLKSVGTLASGHFLLEEPLKFHVGAYADFMKVVSGQDIPGCDVLCADASYYFKRKCGFDTAWALGAKYPSSIARLKGHNITMLEVCPVNWPTDKMKANPFKEFMGLSTYMIFGGITHYNAYGYDFIQDETQHDILNTYVGRLLTVLRNAKPLAPVAVYYPISEVQAAFGAQKLERGVAMDFFPRVLEVEEGMELLLEAMYNGKTDFNVVDEESFEELSAEGGYAQKGLVKASTVLVPFIEYITEKSAQKLKELSDSGVKVIFVDRKPEKDVFGNDKAVKAIIDSIDAECITVDALNTRDFTLKMGYSISGTGYYASPYEICNKRFNYVINVTEEEISLDITGKALIYVPETDTWIKEPEAVKISGERGIFVFEV